MFVEVALLSEPSPTLPALEGFLSSVDPDVVDEIPRLVKEPSAVLVFADVVSEVAPRGFVELVAGRVFVGGQLRLLRFFHFEAFRFVEEVGLLLFLFFLLLHVGGSGTLSGLEGADRGLSTIFF